MTTTTERIAKYQNIIAEAYGQQAEHYRGAEFAAAMGLIRAAIVSVVSTDTAKVARIADVLAALDAVRDAAHGEWESTRLVRRAYEADSADFDSEAGLADVVRRAGADPT